MADGLRQVIVLVLCVAQAIVAPLYNSQLLDPTLTEVSDSFTTYFTPAGITFAVWSVVYLGVILYGVYQAFPKQRVRTVHRRLGWWVALTTLANVAWTPIYAAAGEYGSSAFEIGYIWVSLAVILTLLAILVWIFVQLSRLYTQLTTMDYWLIHTPFSAYLAWVSVATVANATTLLIGLGWSGEQYGAVWSAVMIVVVTQIAIGLILNHRSTAAVVAFGAVIVWGLVGIYLGNNEQSQLVGVVALAAAAVTAVVTGYQIWRLPSGPSAGRKQMNPA